MSGEGNGTALVERSPVNAGKRGLELRSLDDMYRFAKYVSASGLAPKGMERPESILVALQMGAEVGLTPMAALQNIAVVNGRPSIWGDAMLAICQSSGAFDHAEFEEAFRGDGATLAASCTVRRLPDGKPCTRLFSMADAKAAGLQGKSGPWSQYPRRMLQMRARSWALRDTFPDVLRGFKCAEEVQDYIDVESRPAPAPVSNLTDLGGRLAKQLSTAAMTAEDDPFGEPAAAIPESVDPLADWKAKKRATYMMRSARPEDLKKLRDHDCGPDTEYDETQRAFCEALYQELMPASEGHYATAE